MLGSRALRVNATRGGRDPSCETSLLLAIALRDSIVGAASKPSSRGR